MPTFKLESGIGFLSEVARTARKAVRDVQTLRHLAYEITTTEEAESMATRLSDQRIANLESLILSERKAVYRAIMTDAIRSNGNGHPVA
jgi:hypothetical protein